MIYCPLPRINKKQKATHIDNNKHLTRPYQFKMLTVEIHHSSYHNELQLSFHLVTYL